MDTPIFIASNLAKLLIRPETILVGILGWGLLSLLCGRQKRGVTLVAVVLASAVTIGLLPIGQAPLSPLERQYPANPAVTNVAGIILLGGAEDVGASTSWSSPMVNASGDRYLATS